MSTSYKKMRIEVGFEYPYVADCDNTFEILAELSKDELEAIIAGGKSLLLVDSGWDTWEYIECFAPNTFHRLCKQAEEIAVPRWGEKMKTENGAQYIFFLPGDIRDAIFASDEANRVRAQIDYNEKISKQNFHADQRILFENQHRWQEIKRGDFDGIWQHAIGKIRMDYLLETQLSINGNDIKVSYSQNYFLEKKELELSIEPAPLQIRDLITKLIIDNGFNVTKIADLKYSWVWYAERPSLDSDIDLYMEILDNLNEYNKENGNIEESATTLQNY